ncbi:MAG: hypothetical protein ACLQCU_11230 [Acidimicrobiales bacterium]
MSIATQAQPVVTQVQNWVNALRPLFWPGLVLILVAYLIISGQLAKLLSRLRGASGGPFKIELSEEGAKATKDGVETQFSAMRSQLRSEFDRIAKKKKLKEKLTAVMTAPDIAAWLSGPKSGETPRYRCTVHVPDPLLRDHLYQLLDYFPDGQGRGRSFSCRAGLIGVVWRTEAPQESEGSMSDARMVLEWGMTSREAALSRATGRRSFIGVPLKDPQESPVGVLYLDSQDAGTFGDTAEKRLELATALAKVCRDTQLTSCLTEAVRAMLQKSPEIDLRLSG